MFQDSRQEHAKQNHKNSSIIKHYQKKKSKRENWINMWEPNSPVLMWGFSKSSLQPDTYRPTHAHAQAW